ncbi:MAG: B12-binding domain-containing protein, partial [Treponema sp.]|nr:B12-binding domain-containing protein [Treponema sp.]
MSAEITSVLKAFNVLNGNDAGAEKYISFFSATSEKKEKPDTSEKDLITLVCGGQKDAAVAVAKSKLAKEEPLKIIDEYLIPALNIAGKEFEAGRLFLPQLVQSAETA